MVQKGLEIGALDRPMVTREMGNIKYVDYTTTEELKRTCKRRNPDLMVEVDYVWGNTRLDKIVESEFPFDYVIASHVLEHVPDMVGWLNEVSGTLKTGGYLSLALPDKTKCFDYFRPETAISDVVDAYMRRAVKPSPGAIFESKAYAVSYERRISWTEEVEDDSKLVKIFSLPHALQVTRDAYEADIYYDSHCWVFTPYSILELFKALIKIDLLDFRVDAFYPTSGCEFFVTLQKIDTQIRTDASRNGQMRSIPLIAKSHVSSPLEQELDKAKKALKTAQGEIERLRKMLPAKVV